MSRPEPSTTADVVRTLLMQQHPDLAELPLTFGARGWDNELWRLGENLAIRLPWQTEEADALILKEHRWVPTLARSLPLAVPTPIRLGEPSPLYPRPWIVTTWVDGTPADQAPASNGDEAAEALASFQVALHQPAPADAPNGRMRGGPLHAVADAVAWWFETTAVSIPGTDTIRAVFDDGVRAPAWSGPRLWLHGDLHPANLLTTDGTFCGIVDFGDLCAGDPALDLAACWIALPDMASVDRFRTSHPLAADNAAWRRGRAWAVWRALGSLAVAAAPEPAGKPTWGPPALASFELLRASHG